MREFFELIHEKLKNFKDVTTFQSSGDADIWLLDSFQRIPNTMIDSDIGWGCMHRSGQMILGQALSFLFLGRDWRLDQKDMKNGNTLYHHYMKILDFFIEKNIDDHLFCIQRMTLAGILHGKKAGEWFGPSTLAHVFQHLLKGLNEVKVIASVDGLLKKMDFTHDPNSGPFKPIFLIIPVRLGITKINENYSTTMKESLEKKYCTGIALGKNNSSYYCMGYEGEQFICLDPHRVQPSLSTLDDFSSCHTYDTVRIKLADTDPSLLISFLITNAHEMADFLQMYDQQPESSRIYHIIDDEKSSKSPSIDIEQFSISDFEVDEDD